jgi:hypothetical protein
MIVIPLFINIAGPEFFLIAFAVLVFALMLYCLIDIIRSDFKDSATKLLWALLVILFSPLGSLLYLLLGRKQKKLNSAL